MSKRKILIAVTVLIIAVVAIAVVMTRGAPSTTQSTEISATDRAKLLEALQDPFVKHIRTAIDNFNAGSNSGTSVDLKPYSEYLKSKFVLMEINHSAVNGGKDMIIAFTDKHDKFFYVWVYKQADGTYNLRAFEPYKDISPEQAQQIYEGSRSMIEQVGLAI